MKIRLKDKLKYKITVYCLLFTVYCLLSACATKQEFDLVRQDVYKLQQVQLAIKNEIKEKTTGVAKEESFNVVRSSQAEMQSVLLNITREIQNLSGRFDEYKYHDEKTMKSLTSEIDLIKTQITSLEGQIKEIKNKLAVLEDQALEQKESSKGQQKDIGKKTESDKAQIPIEEQPSKSEVPTEKSAKYESAYNAFENKRYREAREQFESFIKEFPQDELTDNAYFWIAETHYKEGDYESAILAYETLLKKYPKSAKVPGALLKQGLSFVEIGYKKEGRIIIEQVIERYPNSREAELAKKFLEDLKKKPEKTKR